MALATLEMLFVLSRCGRPRLGDLAERLGVPRTQVAEALLYLERRGLVDATRARLTMRGLAASVALHGRAGPGRAVPHRPARPPREALAGSIARR